jgi:hypothetical protein
MRLHEFVDLKEEASVCSTVSGGIAPVVTSMGPLIRRNAGSFFAGKYIADDATPNTPAEYKKYKRKK